MKVWSMYWSLTLLEENIAMPTLMEALDEDEFQKKRQENKTSLNEDEKL